MPKGILNAFAAGFLGAFLLVGPRDDSQFPAWLYYTAEGSLFLVNMVYVVVFCCAYREPG